MFAMIFLRIVLILEIIRASFKEKHKTVLTLFSL